MPRTMHSSIAVRLMSVCRAEQGVAHRLTLRGPFDSVRGGLLSQAFYMVLSATQFPCTFPSTLPHPVPVAIAAHLCSWLLLPSSCILIPGTCSCPQDDGCSRTTFSSSFRGPRLPISRPYWLSPLSSRPTPRPQVKLVLVRYVVCFMCPF